MYLCRKTTIRGFTAYSYRPVTGKLIAITRIANSLTL